MRGQEGKDFTAELEDIGPGLLPHPFPSYPRPDRWITRSDILEIESSLQLIPFAVYDVEDIVNDSISIFKTL